MNSEIKTISDRHPPLSYEKRFVSGKVVNNDQGVLHFRLEECVDIKPAPQKARVPKEKIPLGETASNYLLNRFFDLFLLAPTAQDPSLWHASLAWADPDRNPWGLESPYRPKLGNEVSGTVTDFAGDNFAIVTLDNSGIEAFLSWEEIPQSQRPISNILHVGDRILALISTVDLDRLLVHLSINEAINDARRHFHDLLKKSDSQIYNIIQHLESTNFKAQPFSGLRILIVEHDNTFAKYILDLLRDLGAYAVQADNIKHLTQLLRSSDSFTHILCDYYMGNSTQRQELHYMVSRFQLPVALMSGDYADGQSAAQEMNWVFLSKPITYNDLYGWLVNGKIPDPVQKETAISDAWGLGLESRVYLKRAEEAIKDFCVKISVVGAFWVRRQREGVYAILAAYGLDNQQLDQVEKSLSQTLIHDVIDNNKSLGYPIERTGALRETAPIETNAIIGLPLYWNHTKIPDALILYNPGKQKCIEDVITFCQSNLDYLIKRLGDLDELAMLAERLRDAEAFAIFGRVSGAILHEIRQALQPFNTYIPIACYRLEKKESHDSVLDALSHLSKAVQRVDGLVKTNLYNLQKTRQQKVHINQRIKEIISWYLPRAQHHDILIKCEIPDTPLTVSLPPEALEQPLANLLDNAFNHLGQRKWGTINIQLNFNGYKQANPITIEVKDQGQGMTAEQRKSLFSPRISGKKNQAYGLGLYTSRQLLRAVGGDLECVESWRWLGSTFRILLPFNINS